MCFVKEFHDGSALLGVFDGLGGQAAGEKASESARESMKEFNPYSQSIERHLVELMQSKNTLLMLAIRTGLFSKTRRKTGIF